MTEDLDRLVRELEETAARLRASELSPEEAATLVERCAELAGQVDAELYARSRNAAESEGQERLL